VHALTRPRSSRRAGPRDPESGSTAIEFVFWTPLLMLMILAVVQLSMYLFAEHVAGTAAQAGARAAREGEASNAGWQGAAQQAADSWVNDLIGPGTAPTVKAFVSKAAPNACTPPQVEVTVSFTMNSLLGGMTVHGMNEGPVENFYPDDC
jgi:Flp pilus assembly protein TadG